MPSHNDEALTKRVIRKFIKLKKGKYEIPPEIFPEKVVRQFLGIKDNNISCCDGLARRNKKSGIKISISKYDLLEIKGKSFDSTHRELGQSQIRSTIVFFKKTMEPRKAYIFIKEGGWLSQKGYRVKDGKLYKLNSKKPEILENGIPLRVYYYDRNKVYRR